MTVVTRFAPSPTGFLHVGGARTALFNWLFTRHHGGRFLLRIEDTDRTRSTQEAVDAILDGLRWLGLEWDGEAVSQFARAQRHAEVANALRSAGKAYHCYCTQQELAEMRERARREGGYVRYDGRWRDRDPSEAPPGIDPVIRLRVPQDGEAVIDDRVQGRLSTSNQELDDMVLLRADGTPTYMLAVVVDDHDMQITHVVRGDEHARNAFRQLQLYQALDWQPPEFAHVPLIHGPDGRKLSKRHGALGVDAYRKAGYLPEALCNYLLRLGWSHGDDEIITMEQAIRWFELDGIGRSPARFDFAKLDNLNGHYIRHTSDQKLCDLVLPRLVEMTDGRLAEKAENRLKRGMSGLKVRAKTVSELSEISAFYVFSRPLPLTEKATKVLDQEGCESLSRLRGRLATETEWNAGALEELTRHFAEDERKKLAQIAQPLRAALTGATVSPGIFEVMQVLGKEESLGRMDDVLTPRHGNA